MNLKTSYNKIKLPLIYLTLGVGIIQYISPIIRSKKASESVIGEYVKFDGNNLYFCGCSLSGVDLTHIIRVGDTIDVVLKMLETKEGNAQYAAKFGHCGSVPPDDMLMPEGSMTTKKLTDRNLDFETAEKILLKKVGPVSKSLPADTAMGKIIQLDRPDNKETCCKGTVVIETGVHRGKKVKLNRNKLSVLGLSLEKADLLYCVASHEAVFVDVNGIDDYPEGVFVPKFARLISPSEVRLFEN